MKLSDQWRAYKANEPVPVPVSDELADRMADLLDQCEAALELSVKAMGYACSWAGPGDLWVPEIRQARSKSMATLAAIRSEGDE